MKALLLGLAALALASSASAVECSSVELSGKRFTICRVDVRKEHLQLFLRDGNGQLFNRFDRLARWADAFPCRARRATLEAWLERYALLQKTDA